MAMTDEELLLQMKILTEKVDSNPNMTYKSSKILNKGLNPDFYSGNDTKIVNILNDLFEKSEQTTSLANRIVDKVNSILGDTETTDGALAFIDLQSKMGQSTLIAGLNDILDGKHAAKVLGVSEADINKILSVAKDEEGNLVIKAVDQIASNNPVDLSAENISYTNEKVDSITNVQEALDHMINQLADISSGNIIGEITWDMINNKPEHIADGLELTDSQLILKDGGEILSSIQLTDDQDIDNIVNQLI